MVEDIADVSMEQEFLLLLMDRAPEMWHAFGGLREALRGHRDALGMLVALKRLGLVSERRSDGAWRITEEGRGLVVVMTLRVNRVT